jgi:hypothetical protein
MPRISKRQVNNPINAVTRRVPINAKEPIIVCILILYSSLISTPMLALKAGESLQLVGTDSNLENVNYDFDDNFTTCLSAMQSNNSIELHVTNCEIFHRNLSHSPNLLNISTTLLSGHNNTE